VRRSAVNALIARVRFSDHFLAGDGQNAEDYSLSGGSGPPHCEVSTDRTERAIRTASNASILPTPRRWAAVIADGSATSNPALATRSANPAP
jgi:hypothetical protein